MPNIGDYVNYGNQGVCRIDGRRSLKFGSAQPRRDYYILSPVYQKGSRVYVPADNQALLEKMRPVLSPQEIDKAIASVKERDISWISDRKQRLAKSHEILARRDEHELLQLASCFYLKSRDGKTGAHTYRRQYPEKGGVHHRPGVFIRSEPGYRRYWGIYPPKTRIAGHNSI